MKRWLVILSIIFVTSFILCTILAGNVYYRDLKTYTDYDKKTLALEAVENIYIESYIPVDISPTTTQPYVEFEQTFTDFLGLAPKYELKVEHKGNSMYISLDEIGEIFMSLGVKENRARLNVYLPQQAMNKISIQELGFLYTDKERQVINLEGIDVQELEAKMSHVEFKLQGRYDHVNLRLDHGKLLMDSTGTTQLYVDGDVEQRLKGSYDKIIIKNNKLDVAIDSEIPCSAQIYNDRSNIELQGSYDSINIIGDSNNIDFNTGITERLLTKGYNNFINGSGAFKDISLTEKNSEVALKADMIPDKIQLGGCSDMTNIKLILPSNIPGFIVRYAGSEKGFSKREYEVYQDYLLEGKFIQSDFDMVSSISVRGELLYTYGNGKIPITLNEEHEITFELVDGGYSSIQ